EIQKYLDKFIIIRTAWLYSPFGHNFLKTVMRIQKEKGEMSVVDDQTGSPTNALLLAETVIGLINKLNDHTYGIYNLSSQGQTTWFGFAKLISEALNDKYKVNPVTSSEYKTAATRPTYSVLSNEKLTNAFGVVMIDWREGLKKCLEEMF
ncbi:MAG: sugar nucleotide-binding protein, partial [Bacteriovoracaceae bacterium]|nr:sugar nucleotide-binding protein [Bacteriovoracaceae bacterium]